MNKALFATIVISVFGLGMSGCTTSFSTNSGAVNTMNKPANTAPPVAASNTNSTKKAEKPKETLKDEKKPAGESSKKVKNNPVPADWIYVYDDQKGYGFSVPAGTTGDSDTNNGVDYMGLTTPAPSNIDMYVLAYKNKELSKEDLLDDAVSFLEGLGQKVTPGKLKGESDDYAVADATTVTEDGRKGTLRILVGTDVTDNYVMVLGTDTDKFAANEKIIDEIWGSFEMWSGGSSGNN